MSTSLGAGAPTSSSVVISTEPVQTIPLMVPPRAPRQRRLPENSNRPFVHAEVGTRGDQCSTEARCYSYFWCCDSRHTGGAGQRGGFSGETWKSAPSRRDDAACRRRHGGRGLW